MDTSRIEWTISVAPNANGGARLHLSANLPPLKDGDFPVGVAHVFPSALSSPEKIDRAFPVLQRRLEARYAAFNGDEPEAPPGDKQAAMDVIMRRLNQEIDT